MYKRVSKKKEKKEKKDNIIRVCCSDYELETIRRAAKTYGLGISTLVRTITLKYVRGEVVEINPR